MDWETEQRRLCSSLGKTFTAAPLDMKVGIARNVLDGVEPIHGLRHPPVGDTTGWYIWGGGAPSGDPDFFVPLHVRHLETWCPRAIPYLGLPPGARFLVAEGHRDVWDDAALL